MGSFKKGRFSFSFILATSPRFHCLRYPGGILFYWTKDMTATRIVLAAVMGTSAMTLFSYQVAQREKEQFREPELLNSLVKRLPGDTKFPVRNMEGWVIHYTVGTLFVIVYDKLWRTRFKPSVLNGICLGAASGLIGIAGWHAVIRLHPQPPRINLKKYYPHLLVAHVVFGAFAALSYNLVRS